MDYTLGSYHSISVCQSAHVRDSIAKGDAVTPHLEAWAAASAEPAQQLQGVLPHLTSDSRAYLLLFLLPTR